MTVIWHIFRLVTVALLVFAFSQTLNQANALESQITETTQAILKLIIDPNLEASVRYDQLIVKYASEQNLNPELVKAVIQAESNFDANAISPRGAMGLMQVMPRTAASLGVFDNLLDPHQNLQAGTQYLRKLLDRFDNNIELALSAYNAGPTCVSRYKGIPPFQETQNYVRKVQVFLTENNKLLFAENNI